MLSTKEERYKLKEKQLELYCLMTEAVRVVCEKKAPRIWMTKRLYREALKEYLGYLEAATK